MLNKHSFHIVDLRPWPLICSLNLINLVMRLLNIIKYNNILLFYIFVIIFFLILFSMIIWWRDVNRESLFQGNHTFNVYKGVKLGILIFILRELIFFLRFFWRYFHFRLSPEIEISNCWPPTMVIAVNPYRIPLFNTLILLRSGVSVTWAHYRILKNKNFICKISLLITIILGFIFSFFQLIEYKILEFRINDRVFGSIFFIGTGFHGFHVLIGTIFLIINYLRIFKKYMRPVHHFRFEASAWYWHFVDVVWIYLFIFIYWWFYFLFSIISTFNFQLKSFVSKIKFLANLLFSIESTKYLLYYKNYIRLLEKFFFLFSK